MRPRWMRMVMFVPLAIAGFAVFVFIGGTAVMYLWNWLLPSITGWREITFWQALGLLALCRILFGGFGGGPRRRWKGAHISDEEKARFKHRMRARLGFDTPGGGHADNEAM